MADAAAKSAGAPAREAAPAAPAFEGLDLKVSPLRATLLIHASVMGSATPPTRKDVEHKLASLKVLHGVDWKLVDRILHDKLADRTHLIAAATMPKEGRNAWIEQVVRHEVDARPRELENGMVDYKNVDNIRQVEKGQLLAVKHPAVQGQPGIDIFGHGIPPDPVADVELKAGANTVLSDDGLKLMAAAPGFLHHLSGAICVGDEYLVRGDVDFHTGNIRYQGCVRVKGNVTGGFKVEAEGDILVEGIVEGAELVSHKGSVQVLQGVFGQGRGLIRAGGDISVVFAQDVTLECLGTLEVGKGLRNCKAAAGAIKADLPRCALVGGSLKSYSDLRAAVVGAAGCRTDLIIADRQEEAARAKLPEVEQRRARAEAQVGDCDKRMKEIAAALARPGAKPAPELQAAMNKLLAAYGTLKKSLGPLEEERRKLREDLNCFARRTGKAVITDRIVHGGRLAMYGTIRELTPEDAKKEWHWAPDELNPMSILPPQPKAGG